MYKTIYTTLRATGRTKTAMLVNGSEMGSKCILSNGQCIPLCGNTDWSVYKDAIMNVQETSLITVGEQEIFVEIYLKNPRLIILGGGHVSVPVAHFGKMLGFHVTVMDDRAEFATKERFPDADELITGAFEEISEKIPVYENAYYVIVTRGHKGDAECVRQIFKRPYVYLGMIGSRTKVSLTKTRLLDEGYSLEQWNTVHAPIGIPLGGQLPAEIAVSILAEITKVKNEHYVAYCDSEVEQDVMDGCHGVMVTIIKKTGSGPRGIGSKMFIHDDGKQSGSIGGGNVEYQAGIRCREISETVRKAYVLSPADQEDKLGMICGGNIEVVFERV